MIIKVKSPFPDLLQSSYSKEWFSDAGNDYLPYRGSTQNPSHGYLKMLYFLQELSPSQGTCINNIKKYSFKSISGFLEDYIPGLSTDEEPVTKEAKKDIALKLTEMGMSPLHLLHIGRCVSEHLKVCGNAYIHYQMNVIAGVPTVTLNVLHPLKVLINADDNLYNTVSVCNDFINSGDDEIKQYRVFPAFKGSEKKKECVFHIKNEGGSNPHYGTPDTIHTIRSQFIEYALTELSCKVSGRAEVASNVFAFPTPAGAGEGGEDDPMKMIMAIASTINKLLTNEGENAKTIGTIGKPQGEDIQHFKLDVNRDTAWYKENIEIHSGIIYGAHGDNKQLSGQAEAKAGLGGNVVDSLMVKYNEDAILPMQEDVSNALMLITDLAFEDSGNEKYVGTKIIFRNAIESMLLKLQSFKTTKAV